MCDFHSAIIRADGAFFHLASNSHSEMVKAAANAAAAAAYANAAAAYADARKPHWQKMAAKLVELVNDAP